MRGRGADGALEGSGRDHSVMSPSAAMDEGDSFMKNRTKKTAMFISLATLLVASTLLVLTAPSRAQDSKSAPAAHHGHTTGTVVDVHPMPPKEATWFVIKTATGENKYWVSEGADVAPGIKPGDTVTFDYGYDDSGTGHYYIGPTMKKLTGAKPKRN